MTSEFRVPASSAEPSPGAPDETRHHLIGHRPEQLVLLWRPLTFSAFACRDAETSPSSGNDCPRSANAKSNRLILHRAEQSIIFGQPGPGRRAGASLDNQPLDGPLV